jgi:prophage regulatory protein
LKISSNGFIFLIGVQTSIEEISAVNDDPSPRSTCEEPGRPVTASNQKDRRRDRFLRIKAVRTRTGLSTSSIYRREAEGSFPKKHQLGARCVAWYESDIDDFVADPLNYRS